jgi:hypothetical protein
MPNIVRNRPGLQRPQTSSGQRRIRITLKSSSTTADVLGGLPQGNYSEFGQDWAELAEIPFIVSSTEHGMLYQFTVRYRADILNEFETLKKRVRVVDTVRQYQVLEIENPEQRNVELKLHCAPAGDD